MFMDDCKDTTMFLCYHLFDSCPFTCTAECLIPCPSRLRHGLTASSSSPVDDLIQLASNIEEHLRIEEVDFADGVVEVIDAITDVVR